MGKGAFPLVLSLSPTISRQVGVFEIGHTYQAQCIAAWRACGFRVITVNAAAEVEYVSALYPDVEIFVADRDMAPLCGKPLVPLTAMIAALRATGSPVGAIVNSDVFVPPCPLADWLTGKLLGEDGPDRHDCLFMTRQEVSHPASRVGPNYNFGFDAFFFDMSAIDPLDSDRLTIGLPWWDYYLPMALLLAGRDVGQIERLPLRHLSHLQKWHAGNWLLMFEEFHARLHDSLVRLEGERGGALPSLVGLVSEERMIRYFMEAPVARRVEDPGFDSARRYREAYSVSVADLILQLSVGVEWPGLAA